MTFQEKIETLFKNIEKLEKDIEVLNDTNHILHEQNTSLLQENLNLQSKLHNESETNITELSLEILSQGQMITDLELWQLEQTDLNNKLSNDEEQGAISDE